ncbi:MAG: CoA-binding protein [Elusimicrobia bacterium]|nr:CoA-binding protein [Elusimicrobiota bacterium]
MEKQIIAVMGASSDVSKYWYKIFKDIKDYGLNTYCVNPKIPQDKQNRIYNNLADLPEKPDTMIIVLRPELADNAVKQAVESGVKTIWFQPGAYSKAAEQEALKAGLRVHNACFMLAAGIW